MITVAIFNIVFVLFAYLAQYKGGEHFLKVSFFLIFLFLALRYNYGNDYPAYLKGFLNINSLVSIDYSVEYFDFDPGWVFLCRLFQHFGFFAMVAVLAAFNCFVYYRFIKKYVPPYYYWIAVFLYVFDANNMLINSSAMRQSLAISLFIFSLDYLYKKDVIRYFLCVGLASWIHTSALVLFPVYLLGLINFKINKTLIACIFLLYILAFKYADSIQPVIDILMSGSLGKYEHYSESQFAKEDQESLASIIYYGILFLIVLFYGRFQDKETSLLFKAAILSFFIKPFIILIPMIIRIGMYFSPFFIVVFPIVLITITNKFTRIMLLFFLILTKLYLFYQFFQHDVWKEAFASYQTIFSSPKIY